MSCSALPKRPALKPVPQFLEPEGVLHGLSVLYPHVEAPEPYVFVDITAPQSLFSRVTRKVPVRVAGPHGTVAGAFHEPELSAQKYREHKFTLAQEEKEEETKK